MSESPYRDPAVAEIYRRVAVPTHFVRPARDLVTMLRVEAGDKVLDVGTGTGAFASAASDVVGPSGLAVGVDRAAAMLRAADPRSAAWRIVAESPGLPFVNEVFDAVGASFVLAHCRDYSSVLADMARLCRPGGHIGISAWGSLLDEPGRLWRDIVETYVDPYPLQQAFRVSVPWEEWFNQPRNVTDALADTGLTAVHGATREYSIEISPLDYLKMKQAGVEGRLIRQLAGEARWNSFVRQIEAAFLARFSDPMSFIRDVHFGVGTKQ